MTDREALLAAIHAAPDDDLPRLVYADWLEENAGAVSPIERKSAGERAAFIRAQIEAARAEPLSPAAREAEERARRLLTDTHREAWTWELRGKVLDVEFARGFVEHATVDAAQFPDVAESLFASESIRSVRVCRPAPSRSEYEVLLKPVFDLPQLAKLAALDLQGVELNYDDCVNLSESPHLSGVAQLTLRGNPIFPPWLREFIQGPAFPNLAGLDIADIANLGPMIARCLPNAGHRRFRRLDLSGIKFHSRELKSALACECVQQIEELRLRWDGGSDQPGALTHLELGYVLPWENLRLLDLTGQGLGPEGVLEIVRHEHASKLRWLGLARNFLGADGVTALCEDSDLKLYHLDVRFNDLGPKVAESLQRRFPGAVVLV